MKSIGIAIKEARSKKKLSREKLERLTKIKKGLIENLEEERWDLLPDYPVVTGFVKNISHVVGVDEKHLVALLRRDYPPKTLPINPKPEISEKFKWSPRLTFLLGIVVVTLFIVGYLIFQYISFVKPPMLVVNSPSEAESVSSQTLNVRGTVDPDATVIVNNQPALVDDNGNFETEIEIFEGTSEIVVIARSRTGKETVVRRKINVELK